MQPSPTASPPRPPRNDLDPAEARALRSALVRNMSNEVFDAHVLEALERVPRHLFVPTASLAVAYADSAAAIAHGQTISQPTIVAVMTEALELRGDERVLEIGTGSGYQTAVLSILAAEVHSVETIPGLAYDAEERLLGLGYSNVHVHVGDGYSGHPEAAPYDRILLTAAPATMPVSLFEQLVDGGILVAPVGENERNQRLLRYRKRGAMISAEDLGAVQFVPMVPGRTNR